MVQLNKYTKDVNMSIELKIVICSPEGQFFSLEGFLSPGNRFTPNIANARTFDSTWEAFEVVLDTVGGWDFASTPFYLVPKVIEIDLDPQRDSLYSDRTLSSAQYLGADYFYNDGEDGITFLEWEDGELIDRTFIHRIESNIIEKEKSIAELRKDPEWTRHFIKKYLNEDI